MQQGPGFGAQSSTIVFVAPERGPSLKGQQGAVLIFVLSMVLILSIAVVSILAMSLNSTAVAHNLQDSTKGQHRVDGALEEVINDVRNDTTLCSTTADLPATVDGVAFTVTCDPVTSPVPFSRVYNLSVVEQGETAVVGLAQIKVIDWPSLGNKLEVCDWLLGRNVSSPLNSCTSAPVTP